MLELTLGEYSRTLMKEKLLIANIPFHEIGDVLFIKIEGNGHYYKLLNLQKKLNSPKINFKGRHCRFCGVSLQVYGGLPYKNKKGSICFTCANYFFPDLSYNEILKLWCFDLISKKAITLKLFK